MAAGPNSPSTVVNVAKNSNTDWTNPSNATTSDDAYASSTKTGYPLSSDYLKCTNFGFALGATTIVLGIKVETEQYYDTDNPPTSNILFAHIVKTDVIDATAKTATLTAAEGYITHGGTTDLWGKTWLYSDINDATFGVALWGYINCSYLQPCSYSRIYIDHVRITVYYYTEVAKTQSDLVASVTEAVSVDKSSGAYTIANNNQGYVFNLRTKAWTFVDNLPFVDLIYRPISQTIIGARRDTGNLATINSGDTFDGTNIDSIIQTGYMNFGILDEIKGMPANASEALKRLRAFFSEIRSEGNLTLTVYTENDSTGKTYTITPATTDNAVYNAVRTTLGRDIRGKYVSFKITNSSGQNFWIGETGIKIIARALK